MVIIPILQIRQLKLREMKGLNRVLLLWFNALSFPRRCLFIGHWTITSCICMSWLHEWTQRGMRAPVCLCACALWSSEHPQWCCLLTVLISVWRLLPTKALRISSLSYWPWTHPATWAWDGLRTDAAPELSSELDAGALPFPYLTCSRWFKAHIFLTVSSVEQWKHRIVKCLPFSCSTMELPKF